MSATEVPVRRRGAKPKELHTTDIPIQQKAAIIMPGLDAGMDRQGEIIVPPEAGDPLHRDYLEALKFAEEPVRIQLHPSSERNAAAFTEMVSVNGKKAEIFIKNRWEERGFLPRGVALTVKRKVVEVLARAKADHPNNRVTYPDGLEPVNVIETFTQAMYPFSVIEDKNPKGREWLMRLASSRA